MEVLQKQDTEDNYWTVQVDDHRPIVLWEVITLPEFYHCLISESDHRKSLLDNAGVPKKTLG